jgi:hypothetical protein
MDFDEKSKYRHAATEINNKIAQENQKINSYINPDIIKIKELRDRRIREEKEEMILEHFSTPAEKEAFAKEIEEFNQAKGTRKPRKKRSKHPKVESGKKRRGRPKRKRVNESDHPSISPNKDIFKITQLENKAPRTVRYKQDIPVMMEQYNEHLSTDYGSKIPLSPKEIDIDSFEDSKVENSPFAEIEQDNANLLQPNPNIQPIEMHHQNQPEESKISQNPAPLKPINNFPTNFTPTPNLKNSP